MLSVSHCKLRLLVFMEYKCPQQQVCFEKLRSRRCCNAFGCKEQGCFSWEFSPFKTDLEHTLQYLNWPHPPTPPTLIPSFYFHQPLLNFSLSPHRLSHSSRHISQQLLAAFRWMVPTVRDPDLQSSDWLSQRPVVLPHGCAVQTRTRTMLQHKWLKSRGKDVFRVGGE